MRFALKPHPETDARMAEPEPLTAGAPRFATTHWSLVVAAGQGDSPDARAALATLCQTYWYPLYAYVRRHGRGAEEAQDLTQAFFAELLEKEYLQDADRERGKFRAFLLTAFKHFLSKERDRASALKRGGGRATLSLDLPAGERRYRLEPADQATPETLFERRWALTLLDQVLARLRQEYAGSGKGPLFEQLKGFLAGEKGPEPYAQLAREFGMTEGAFKVAVHRVRRRYRELLRAEIAQTVDSPEEVDDELRHLFEAIRSPKNASRL
jgi:RNA polymerase sigma-70 factor (ECF subfamily)